eukprot:6191637-Pleurochrysis_carterae.AAC.1
MGVQLSERSRWSGACLSDLLPGICRCLLRLRPLPCCRSATSRRNRLKASVTATALTKIAGLLLEMNECRQHTGQQRLQPRAFPHLRTGRRNAQARSCKEASCRANIILVHTAL